MNATVVAAIIAASVSTLTLIAQYFGRRATSRELDRTFKEQYTRGLNERFATAADRLGIDKSASIRLAGVYAMAGLADDWEDNRQTCIDVLCGYLRMPSAPDPGAPDKRRGFLADREVRHTLIRVITAHLKDDARVSWQGWNFDFTGVVFDGGDFSHARFSRGAVSFVGAEFPRGAVNFSYAKFSGGTVNFTGAKFSGGAVNFYGAEFSGGTVDFDSAEFSGDARVDFHRARFSGGMVSFRGAKFPGGKVGFTGAEFSSGAVGFYGAKFPGGTVDFSYAKFSGGTVGFTSATFSGGTVSFTSAEFSGSAVDFSFGAEFSGGTVDFYLATFSGGAVSFVGAEFLGGTVDFSRASGGSCPPIFPWRHTPPPGVKLPENEDQTQAQGSPD